MTLSSNPIQIKSNSKEISRQTGSLNSGQLAQNTIPQG